MATKNKQINPEHKGKKVRFKTILQHSVTSLSVGVVWIC